MVSFLNNLFSGIGSDKSLTRVSGNDVPGQGQGVAELFSQGLKRGVGVELPTAPEVDPASPIFDVQAVVDSVAGFIEQRIGQRQAEGASQDELNDLISQAREGVAKGFELARGDIESLGLLEPELSENIDAAEQGINGRIDQLEENLSSDGEGGVLTTLSGATLSDTRSFERQRASFQFELTTQEGDRIRVSAREVFQSQERSSSIQTDDLSVTSFDARYKYASSFSLKVQGDLNDEELAALDELLVQVADISDAFFAGGVEEAFNQALDLEFNSEQIAQFSLDLKASSLSIVERTDITTTQQNARIPEEYRGPQIPRGLQSLLSSYAERVEQLVESAKQASEKLDLLESGDSLAKTLQREFDQSVGRGRIQNDFFDALLEQLS